MAQRVIDSKETSTYRIQPNQANNYGNAHGGTVVRLMDELAAIAAMNVAREICVTAHIGAVDFHSPIPVGDVAAIEAFAYETGRTSVKIYSTVTGRDPRAGHSTHTTSAHFTMVAVDEAGNPTTVPDLRVATDAGEALLEKVDHSTGTNPT